MIGKIGLESDLHKPSRDPYTWIFGKLSCNHYIKYYSRKLEGSRPLEPGM